MRRFQYPTGVKYSLGRRKFPFDGLHPPAEVIPNPRFHPPAPSQNPGDGGMGPEEGSWNGKFFLHPAQNIQLAPGAAPKCSAVICSEELT